MDGKRIRPFAARQQCWWQCHGRFDPVWLAEESPRTRWPVASGHRRHFARLGLKSCSSARAVENADHHDNAVGENRTHDTVSTVSRASDQGDRAGLNHPPPGLEGALIVQTMLTVVTQNSPTTTQERAFYPTAVSSFETHKAG
jgi:hypothetical protein